MREKFSSPTRGRLVLARLPRVRSVAATVSDEFVVTLDHALVGLQFLGRELGVDAGCNALRIGVGL